VGGRLNGYRRHLIRGSRILGIPVLVAAILLATAAPAGAAKPALDTLIDSAPIALTNSTAATFTFHSTGSSPTFACSLDGAASSPCTTPKTYSSLPAGTHTFSVASSAGGQTDTSPATSTWTIDLSPPTAPTMQTPSTPSATSVVLTWKAGTDNTGVTGDVILRDATTLATVGNVTTYTDSTVKAGSTHSYAVMAKDGAGNQSPDSNTVSATTPLPPSLDTTITSGPAGLTNSTSASFGFSATLAGATFTCKLDNGKAATCTSPTMYKGLASANHTFSVYASLNGASDATPATATWTVDTIAPSTPQSILASTSSASVALTWTASTDNLGVTGYDIFRGGTLLSSAGAATSYTDSTVSNGSMYTYTVRARDGAGNTSALSDPATAVPRFPYDPSLTRAPYLTDLVNLHVAINWATNQSATTGGVLWGSVGAGNVCQLTNTLPATRTSILVGTIGEYQWKGDLTLPATGKYCYRVYLGSTDLLGANPSPSFTTQIPFGSTQSFSFDVFGDWGQTDANGQNQNQSNLQAQIANSGASFAVTVGDNGQPTGSQINYGDLEQTGSGASAIFGPQFWTIPGASVPLFTAAGNHGLSGIHHTDITTWTQATAVSTSNGRYQNDLYGGVNGSNATNYGSEWYAFSAGNVRFYILDAAWGDTNPGTATPYANDALAHFAPGTPEYTWLLNDLQTHPTQLKFAFFHYPLYSDNPDQSTDTYLDGATNLEGVLGQHGVQLVFNGHAHIYERNRASATGMPITYVTGGGGAISVPIGPCSAYDAYGIGWSPTKLQGTACGAAKAPTSDAQVRHFLKVTVSGTSVTVTPTDSTGHTFDVQTYTFKAPTDTYIDSAPPAGTTSSSATFTFHASGSPATYTCKLDNGTSTPCTSPVTYSGLTQGMHTFSVAATVNKSLDPTPALATWTVDTTPPAPPTGLTAAATSPFTVNLTWAAATDNTGVTGYDIYRDGALYQTTGAVSSFTDPVLGGSTHTYALVARDVAGNVSSRTSEVSVTTPPPPAPVFSDGFESGTFKNWNSQSGLNVEAATVHSGTYSVEGNTTAGATFAKKTLPGIYPDAYARVWFDVVAQPSQVNLLRLRDASGQSLGYVYIETTGQLGYHNDALGTNTLSDLSPSPGWHVLELRLAVDPTAGVVQIWLDNSPVADLSSQGINTGSTPVAALQIGEVQGGLTYDVAFDDVAFGTSRLGPAPDNNPPTVPTGVTASATSAFSVQLGWTASSDDIGVAGYDVFRGSTLVASVGNVTTWTDTGALAGQYYTYSVRARDVSGNVSDESVPVSVTTPAPPVPVFADGFESGDLSAWTTASNLTVQGDDVNAGAFAAQGNPTAGPAYARVTLPSTANDAYARVAFDIHNQGSQVVLLRLSDTPTGKGGYLYLSQNGYLGFHNDATGTSATTDKPGPGWHVLELHLNISAGTVEVWLDGAPVGALNQTGVNLGANPMGVLQIGDSGSDTWNAAFDSAAFGISRLGPIPDTNPPTVPSGVSASAASPFSVQLGWTASTDDVGVAGYNVFRNGSPVAKLASDAIGYTDNGVLAGQTYTYTVRARDVSGNVSGQSDPVSVTTPAPPVPVFADGFESGDVSAWTTASNLTVQGDDVNAGSFAAQGNPTGGAAYAKETLPSSYNDAYARVAFDVHSQGSQVVLLRLRNTPTGTGGYLFLSANGYLGFHNDAAGTSITTTVRPTPGWRVLELHLNITAGKVEVWLDGAPVTALSQTGVNLGSNPMGVLEIGDTANDTWNVALDNAAFGTSRLGPIPDANPPTVPTGVTAGATSPFSMQVGWTASTDDVGVAGYDVFRGSTLVAKLAADTTSYTDTGVLASQTYTYTVRARDVSGNLSAQSDPVSVTAPAAAAPVFANGFESGDLSAWTTTSGLTVQGTDVGSGAFAALGQPSGTPAYASETLPSAYSDAYARVAFNVQSETTQVLLLHLRDSAKGSGGYLYLTPGGYLGFHNDATGDSKTAGKPGPGWHTLELHLNISAGIVEVWLDGPPVIALNQTGLNLGANPVNVLEIGDTAKVTWNVAFDNAAFGTSRLGPIPDTNPPTVPAGVTATATSPYSVQVGWTASTDDVGVAGYDVFRGSTLVAKLAADATSYTDSGVLASQTYGYTVRARDVSGNVSGQSDPVTVTTPADAPPSVPSGVTASATSPFSVQVGWTASSDDVGLAGYDVFRNGGLVASPAVDATGYTDADVLAAQTYTYTVRARDGSGNASAQSDPVSVTTPAAGAPVFTDGFESSDLSAWTTSAGLNVQGADVNTGAFAAQGTTSAGPAYARETLPSTYNDAYARVAFNVQSQGSQVVLLRLYNAASSKGGYLYLTPGGSLGFRNDATGTSIPSTVRPTPGWHVLELHLNISAGIVEVWLDGAPVTALNQTGVNLGANPVGVLQIGDTAKVTWSVTFDNAAFSTSRIGLQ
jgi:hypothetical protein